MITQKPLHRFPSNLDEGCVDRYLDKGTDRFLTIFNTASAVGCWRKTVIAVSGCPKILAHYHIFFWNIFELA